LAKVNVNLITIHLIPLLWFLPVGVSVLMAGSKGKKESALKEILAKGEVLRLK